MKRIFILGALVALLVAGCAKGQTDSADEINHDASLPTNIPYDPLQWKVIASGLNQQDSTMWTLSGNQSAVVHARSTPQGAYPAGCILARVTWQKQEDKRWFGARIPGKVKSIEFVTVENGSDNKPAYAYQCYAGSPLAKMPDEDAAALTAHLDLILGQRASVMP